MVTKKSRKPAKKVKSLPAKSVSARQARGVKGGDKAKGGGKATVHDMSFTHNIDKSSPVL
jgi:type VI protein secretion system component Hcp